MHLFFHVHPRKLKKISNNESKSSWYLPSLLLKSYYTVRRVLRLKELGYANVFREDLK
jgi:hypothetical protein